MANLKAMDSDWFGQTYMGRKSKVKTKVVVSDASERRLVDSSHGTQALTL